MPKVKNAKGTSRFNPPAGYSSWLDYWERTTGQKATECHKILCNGEDNLVGAHVMMADEDSRKLYIVPLCKECNKLDEPFYVTGPLVDVPSRRD